MMWTKILKLIFIEMSSTKLWILQSSLFSEIKASKYLAKKGDWEIQSPMDNLRVKTLFNICLRHH